MFKQARWMLLAAAVLAGGLIGARPAAADQKGEPHKGLPQRHFGTVLGDHMDHRCCGRAERCDYIEENKVRKNDRVVTAGGKITCCAYVACCEVGNRGFFTMTTCQTCTDRSGAPVHTGKGSCCCNSPKGETLRYH
jgi:hypothetical protein